MSKVAPHKSFHTRKPERSLTKIIKFSKNDSEKNCLLKIKAMENNEISEKELLIEKYEKRSSIGGIFATLFLAGLIISIVFAIRIVPLEIENSNSRINDHLALIMDSLATGQIISMIIWGIFMIKAGLVRAEIRNYKNSQKKSPEQNCRCGHTHGDGDKETVK